MIHVLRWVGILIGIWTIRQILWPGYTYRHRRPADGSITRVTY